MWSLLLFTLASVKAVPFAPAPQTISLTARTVPNDKGCCGRQGPLQATNVPLNDLFRGTDLQWTSVIGVGTPPQNFTVAFATGGSFLAVPSTTCGERCSKHRLFDPTKSSSYSSRDRPPQSMPKYTGYGVEPGFQEYYLAPIRETVTVAGLTAPETNMWLIEDESPALNFDGVDGIVGLPAVPAGFFPSFMAHGLPAIFSLYFTPNGSGRAAELTLGGIDTTKFAGGLTYLNTDGTWTLESTGISVNGLTTSDLDRRREIQIDSGTANIVLDKTSAEAVYRSISKDIQPLADQPGAYGIPCHLLPSLPAVISFAFKSFRSADTLTLTVPSADLGVGPTAGDPSVCQTLINASEDGDVVGGVLLKHYYSVFDMTNSRIGFAPTGEGAVQTGGNPPMTNDR